MRLHLEGSGSAGGQVGIDGLGELQVNGTAGGKVQSPLVFESQAALRAQVGILAGDVERVEIDASVRERGVDASRALQVDAFYRYRQLLQAGLAAQFIGLCQRPRDGDCAGQRGFAVEALDVRQLQQGADVELRKIEFGLGCVVPAERRLAV